ncbi:hypothetical protein [Paraferrimonas sp. SM1919]|uniref:hypothetical protein n=1 Tax=Paraferrimonas sp. SM1919 TaxID=2662263 RepID=UPI0013D74E08|nr:hypothetical protein [Paraferrimonas sp. SM1919]
MKSVFTAVCLWLALPVTALTAAPNHNKVSLDFTSSTQSGAAKVYGASYLYSQDALGKTDAPYALDSYFSQGNQLLLGYSRYTTDHDFYSNDYHFGGRYVFDNNIYIRGSAYVDQHSGNARYEGWSLYHFDAGYFIDDSSRIGIGYARSGLRGDGIDVRHEFNLYYSKFLKTDFTEGLKFSVDGSVYRHSMASFEYSTRTEYDEGGNIISVQKAYDIYMSLEASARFKVNLAWYITKSLDVSARYCYSSNGHTWTPGVNYEQPLTDSLSLRAAAETDFEDGDYGIGVVYQLGVIGRF